MVYIVKTQGREWTATDSYAAASERNIEYKFSSRFSLAEPPPPSPGRPAVLGRFATAPTVGRVFPSMVWLRYRCRPSKPHEFIGFGALDVAKPYKFIWFGDIGGPKPYDFIGSGGFYFADTGSSQNKSFG